MRYFKPFLSESSEFKQLDLCTALDGRELTDIGGQTTTFVSTPSGMLTMEVQTQTRDGQQQRRQVFNVEQAVALRDFLTKHINPGA